MEWEPTSSIETPPSFLPGDRTPPNLVIDLERGRALPRSQLIPWSTSRWGMMRKISLEGYPHLTKKENSSPLELKTILGPPHHHKKKKIKSVPFNNDAMHLHEGKGEKTYFAPLLISPDLLISSQ